MKINVVDHPLIRHKITMMRLIETNSKDFRELLDEITMLMSYEITRDFVTEQIDIETPVSICRGYRLALKDVIVVPILRAGLGMTNGVLKIIPNGKVGHVGLFRDPETLEPHEYYFKMPPEKDAEVIVVDPMLATGGSASAAITMIKERGYHNIRFMCLVSAPEGVKALNEAHPDVEIYTAALDDCLNEHGYIVPGLGDAGDRIFGTK